MAWVSIHDSLLDSPKLRKTASLLGISRLEAEAILINIWLWGLRNADKNGRILYAEAEDIADGGKYRWSDQEIKPDHLIHALEASGWLSKEQVKGETIYRLHDWEDWQDQWYKALDRREQDAKRKRTVRAAEREQKEEKSKPVAEVKAAQPKEPDLQDKRFEIFWKEYPKKTAKAYAKKAFEKVKATEEVFNSMMQALKAQKVSKDWTKEHGRFIPNPATWLNGGYWENEEMMVDGADIGNAQQDWGAGFETPPAGW